MSRTFPPCDANFRNTVRFSLAALAFFPLFLPNLSPAEENAPLVTLREVEGDVISGKLLQFDSGKISLETVSTGTKTFASEKVLEIVPENASAAPDVTENKERLVLELVDGSRIVASDVKWDENTLTLVLPDGKERPVPMKLVGGIRFALSLDNATQEAPKELMDFFRESFAEDRLIVGEEGAYDYHAGIVRGVSPTSVQFEFDEETLNVNRKRITAMIFRTVTPEERKNEACRFTEKDGSLWVLTELSFDADKREFLWSTVSGLTGKTPWSQWSRISFAGKNVRALLDLSPSAITYTPGLIWDDLQEQHPLQLLRKLSVSKTVNGGGDGEEFSDIQLDGKSYASGYSLAAQTEMTFTLDEEYRTLRGFAGIDDRVRPYGKATLLIRGDQSVLLEETILGEVPAKAIDVNLTGVRKLTFILRSSGTLAPGTRVNLVEMVLLK